MSSESQFEFTPSLKIIYFGVGFTMSAASTAVLLTVLRPMIMGGPSWLRTIAMFGPLIIGVPFGLRVVRQGSRNNLRLFAAIKKAIIP